MQFAVNSYFERTKTRPSCHTCGEEILHLFHQRFGLAALTFKSQIVYLLKQNIRLLRVFFTPHLSLVETILYLAVAASKAAWSSSGEIK